jgi:hypothetical protein
MWKFIEICCPQWLYGETLKGWIEQRQQATSHLVKCANDVKVLVPTWRHGMKKYGRGGYSAVLF